MTPAPGSINQRIIWFTFLKSHNFCCKRVDKTDIKINMWKKPQSQDTREAPPTRVYHHKSIMLKKTVGSSQKWVDSMQIAQLESRVTTWKI